MESDGEHFLAYYLPKEDEAAESFAEQRRNREGTEARYPNFVSVAIHAYDNFLIQETVFSFIRDYETIRVEQEVPNEFLLVIEDDDAGSELKPARQRSKGAYYKNIERKILLKKKRANVSRLLIGLLSYCILLHHKTY